ncbi:MAG: MFS transporter [Proteobacteria bacterium]|nr:MFS transporter [Pseudomonadota bacterium]MBU4288078.1 MFS transporter [Pseudomonadota bacterium]MBU4414433.1 MFS transporter [Pseudomonadota bacterium]MCG2757744.1 MFS transporter [Desulfobacteraceae bacterium]
MRPYRQIEIFSGITRNIFIMGLVSLFTDLSSQMVFPLIPLFLTTVLGCGAYAVGIVEGAAETTASLLKVVSGYWSDKIRKRKPFILFGYSMSTITKPLFALANIWTFVLFLRVIERIGKGIRTAPRDALVAESCDESVRGKAFGFHRAADGIGSTLGAVLALLLLPMWGYRNIFLFAMVPGIISVFIIFLIKEKNAPLKQETKEMAVKLSLKELPLNLKLFIIISSLFALGHFGYAFLLLRAKNIGLADNMAIFLYVIFYIVYSICAFPLGIVSDKVGRKAVLMGGYVLFGITSLGLLVASSLQGILLFFIIYGISYSMIDGTQRAFVVDLAPQHLRGTALGLFHTAIGLVALPGGYIAGLLWDKISPEATFGYGLILAIISAVLLIFIK